MSIESGISSIDELPVITFGYRLLVNDLINSKWSKDKISDIRFRISHVAMNGKLDSSVWLDEYTLLNTLSVESDLFDDFSNEWLIEWSPKSKTQPMQLCILRRSIKE